MNRKVKKILNWKRPGPDGVHCYWQKGITTLHESKGKQIDYIISNREVISKWMTVGNSVLCQKDPSKANSVDNYRPILCLPLTWNDDQNYC